MKTLKILNVLLWVITCGIIFSCQQMPEDEDFTSITEEKNLKIEVRSATGVEISYPLYLYAFNKEGKLTASQTVNDSEEEMALP